MQRSAQSPRYWEGQTGRVVAIGKAFTLKSPIQAFCANVFSMCLLSLAPFVAVAQERLQPLVDGSYPATFEQIRTVRDSGDDVSAIMLAEEALSRNPANTDILVLMGYMRLSTDLAAAEQAFLTALQHAPDYHDATLGLAIIHFRRGELPEAARLARRVLDAVPDYDDARALMANIQSAAPNVSNTESTNIPTAEANAAVGSKNLVSPSKPPLRHVLSFGVDRSLDARREADASLNIQHFGANGWTLGWRLRMTSRSYGKAKQVAFSLNREVSGEAFGAEIGVAAGADNLPDLKVGLSHKRRLNDRRTVASHLVWTRYLSGEITTFTPEIIIHGGNGVVYRLRMPVSVSSVVSDSAAVADLRLRVPVSDNLSIRAGVVYGSEFDQLTKRRVRGLSTGISYQLNDRSRINAGFAIGPYADTTQIRLNVGLMRRF